MQKISLEERKKIQLDMLVEIDALCRKHNIKYMLAFGTLLGAVRHKGFIPWDDDVDISMPLEDMFRFKEILKSEKLKYCDIDTEVGYEYSFSRISCKSTFGRKGLVKSYGISIDLYPLIEVSSSDRNINVLLEIGKTLLHRRLNYIKWLRRIQRILPINTIPGFYRSIKKYRNYNFQVLPQCGGGRFHCIAGPLHLFEKHTFDFNPFENLIEVEFEGYNFLGPAKYHEYLTKRYGDYTQLPPEKDRHPYHGGNYYWK